MISCDHLTHCIVSSRWAENHVTCFPRTRGCWSAPLVELLLLHWLWTEPEEALFHFSMHMGKHALPVNQQTWRSLPFLSVEPRKMVLLPSLFYSVCAIGPMVCFGGFSGVLFDCTNRIKRKTEMSQQQQPQQHWCNRTCTSLCPNMAQNAPVVEEM